MGTQIIKQPNGRFAVFSSRVNDFILMDATPLDIIEDLVSEYRKKVEEDVNKTIDALTKNEKPYYQFTLSFDEAIESIKESHGKNAQSIRILKKSGCFPK